MGHLLKALNKKNPIIQDGFNRADSAVTMGNANTGQAWVPLAGTWGISGNQAYTTDTASVDITTVDILSAANASITATIKFSASEGIVFRLTDINNYLILRMNSTSFTFNKNVAGALSQIAVFAFTPVVGNIYTFKVILNGSTLQGYLDGVLRISVTETFNQTATKCGLRTSASPAGRFDNFLVESL